MNGLQNTSVLENHHWRSAIGCLLESHLVDSLSSVRGELEQQISSLILATDITRQQEFLNKFKVSLHHSFEVYNTVNRTHRDKLLSLPHTQSKPIK